MILNSYLTFPRNCEEAFNYYKTVFGGDFAYLGRFGDMPPQGDFQVPEEDRNLIMHVSLPLGENQVLMGSDQGDKRGELTMGDNVSLSVTAESKERAQEIFAKLADGGQITMPLQDTFWGDYFGMCTDKFGVHWMLSV